MTNTQITTAIKQSENIFSMMTADEKSWFAGLNAHGQFHVMCAMLAATAY